MSQINILIRPSSCLSLPARTPSTNIPTCLWAHSNSRWKSDLERTERDKPAAGMPLGYHTGDGVRLLRQLLLSKSEHTASPSRADMDAVPLRNEGVMSRCAVALMSNVSDCSLGSRDQLTQSQKQRAIKQAREGLANPLLRDSRCLT
jgi:hypothetical protein